MRHLVQWTAPAPFWSNAADRSDASRLAMRRPALLRFANDEFMEEFHDTLDTDPLKLRDLEAKYETWKKPARSSAVVTTPALALPTPGKRLARLRLSIDRRLARLDGSTALLEPPPDGTEAKPLKLYQPAHQRFYLVAAGLVCRLPGLPDRAINAAHQEKASFLLRRVRTVGVGTAAVTQEYGFVPSRTGGTWTPIQRPDQQLAEGEERLSLFAVNFHDDEGLRRRVMAGLIPAGKREVYVGSPEAQPVHLALPSLDGDLSEPGAPAPPVDPRIALLTMEVTEPWKTLVQQANQYGLTLRHPENAAVPSATLDPIRKEARETLQVGSWYVLLDFARFLKDHLRAVWDALPNTTSAGLSPEAARVWDALNVTLPAGITLQLQLQPNVPAMTIETSLRTVLHTIDAAHGDRLEGATNRFDRAHPTTEWPDFLFPLVDIAGADEGFNGVPIATTPVGPANMTELQKALRRISALRDLINAALPSTPTAAVPDLPVAAQAVMTPGERAMFVVRCVLERPDCAEPLVFSAPSEPFELANFFDPDAPARPLRIALPIDTSPAGLRRAPKNAAFVMSDILCGQVNRAKKMGFIDLVLSVLPWPFHKDLEGGSTACEAGGDSMGMICSLSIPIITICALIILIIMVTLLDLIFRWLPYLFFCFPLPKFSGKAGSA
jgi:hypothetical protein